MRHVGVLESNTSGSGFEGLRAAKELGCRVTFFTSGMERYLAVPGGARYFEDFVDEIVLCRTNALEELRESVHEVHRRLPFDGFFSFAEYEVVDAALIAEELGLPTSPATAVAAARNKILMRRRCAEAGVPMPAFRAVSTPQEARDAVRAVGLPCVVKPADETASAEVLRCDDEEAAVEHVRAVLARRWNVRGQLRHPQVLVEECVTGVEVSVELLAAGDDVQVLGVTDKSVGGANRFVELGHLFPSLLPDAVRRACEETAVAAVRALGLTLGLLHVEVKWTDRGPRLIEVNPRPAGDRITDLVDLGLGGSCLTLAVRQYLGETPDPGRIGPPLRGAAIRYLTAPAGRVTAVGGLAAARRLNGVLAAVVAVGPGDDVAPLARNEDRVGYVLAVAETSYLAHRVAEAAAHQITVAVDTAVEAGATARLAPLVPSQVPAQDQEVAS